MFNMKKLIMAFLIIFGLSMIGLMIYTARIDDSLKIESKRYVDETLPHILHSLDKDIFLKYASPEFVKAVSDKKVGEIFEVYKKLGEFKKYLGSKGKVKTSFSFKKGKLIYAKYTAKASYSTGDAIIKLTIIKHGDSWSIYAFKIDSKVFSKKDNETKG